MLAETLAETLAVAKHSPSSHRPASPQKVFWLCCRFCRETCDSIEASTRFIGTKTLRKSVVHPCRRQRIVQRRDSVNVVAAHFLQKFNTGATECSNHRIWEKIIWILTHRLNKPKPFVVCR